MVWFIDKYDFHPQLVTDVHLCRSFSPQMVSCANLGVFLSVPFSLQRKDSLVTQFPHSLVKPDT